MQYGARDEQRVVSRKWKVGSGKRKQERGKSRGSERETGTQVHKEKGAEDPDVYASTCDHVYFRLRI
jgi:hypothetical protein